MKPLKFILLLLLSVVSLSLSALAQISYSSGTYTQSFDSLPLAGSSTWTDNVTLPGWYAYRTKLASFTTLVADTGTNASTGNLYSYGNAGTTDRALGLMPGSTPGDVMMGIRIRNNSGHTITSFTMSYDGEQWRAFCTAPQMLAVSYQIGSPANLNSGTWTPLPGQNFTGPVVSTVGAVNGNDPANNDQGIGGTVSGIVWPAGTDLWIRWANTWLTGANASLAVDNFSFSASTDAIVYSGGTYTETFDSLLVTGTMPWVDSGTLPGWYSFETHPGTPFATLAADTGSNGSTGNLYSYGTAGTTDRALGGLPGTTPGTPIAAVRMRNNTGTTLTSFTVTYDGEQWRSTCTAPQLLQASYQIGTPTNLNSGTWTNASGLNFTGPIVSQAGALPGNTAPNCTRNITFTVGPIVWPQGTDLWIRFANGGSLGTLTGNAGLALDNFRFSADSTTTFDANAPLRQEALDSISNVDQMLVAARSPETRQLADVARFALALQIPGAVNKAEYYMTRIFNVQLSNGNFPWYITGTTQSDANTVQFTMRPIGVIFARYLSQLDSSFITYATPHIQSALTAVSNQAVTVDYTNIYTMQAVNLLVLGQVESNTTAQTKGLTNLNTWVKYVQQNGFSEYDSPTYSMVDYINLSEGLNNVTNTFAKTQLKGMLDFLSFDLCLNYLNSYSGSLAGAASRDYTFTTGDDDIGHFYYLAGLRSAVPVLQPYEANAVESGGAGVAAIANVLEGGYVPASAISSIGHQATRIITQKVGAPVGNVNIGKDRYTYITPDVAIGSASRYYYTVDKQISAGFPASQAMSQISVVYDAFDNPYGTIKVPEPGTGDLKVLHLDNGPANIQSKGNLLSLSNLNPQFMSAPTATYTSLASNFLFPTNASKLYLNGSVITPGSSPIATTVNSVLGIRQGNGIVAIRPFAVDGYNGYTPTLAIKFDGPVGYPPTGRLVCYHYQGAAVTIPTTTSIRTGFIIVAGSATSDAAALTFLNSVATAPITSTVSGNTWSASTTLSGITLGASELLNTWSSIVSRTVNGVNYVPTICTASDGTTTTDYAASLLNTIPTN